MEQAIINPCDPVYPVLIIPKRCTTLETSCEVTDNVFINLNITTPDTEGNDMCIYNGFCNVKLIDSYDVNVHRMESPTTSSSLAQIDNEPLNDPGNQISYPMYNQSQVWIDPVRSPFVYNSNDAAQEYSIFHQTKSGRITVEQHNTYITQNVFNYKESNHYSPAENLESKKYRKVQPPENFTQQSSTEPNSFNLYEEDEFQCGVFLSQLPEEIMNEKEIKDRAERKYIGLQSENEALKQLMSADIQSVSKQRKTILFLGHDSHCGQTIQKIAVNDPSLVCCAGNAEMGQGTAMDDTALTNPHQKRYQCDKCKQIFEQISAFKQHMVGSHRTPRSSSSYDGDSTVSEVKFLCTECGKSLKNQEKFELHCIGHGDPDLECNKCHKVFASKFTLRTHRKLHYRKYQCKFCPKTYADAVNLRTHVTKIHFMFMCDTCHYVAEKYSELRSHQELHSAKSFFSKDNSEIELPTSIIDDTLSDIDIITPSPEGHRLRSDIDYCKEDEIQKADSVIAKVMSNKIFLLHAKKARKHKKYNKTCEVCLKVFDRVGDLKRHLIEHIIRSTLAKTPVNKNGTLNIQCEVCQVESFIKIDSYKAHLREHAKLTLYKCTFCNKSFSDSSNFSKHKKIHGTTYLQCDLCQRKFNSKKMITQHMEYHNRNTPIQCPYCPKLFHFKSMLNKHIKCAHNKEVTNKFRCRFCHNYFKSLKEKWDHEWTIHNVRKMIVDCLICGSKFRKYSELKRHCIDIHDMEIPPAKKLLKKRKF